MHSSVYLVKTVLEMLPFCVQVSRFRKRENRVKEMWGDHSGLGGLIPTSNFSLIANLDDNGCRMLSDVREDVVTSRPCR